MSRNWRGFFIESWHFLGVKNVRDFFYFIVRCIPAYCRWIKLMKAEKREFVDIYLGMRNK
jgi:hypothetical protein